MYKCECGREFDNPQKFNGHKANCKQHYEAKYGDTTFWNITQKRRGNEVSKSLKKYFKTKQETSKNTWISEQHKCERCGKIMTEKFGSGRFCSRSCANSKLVSNETKQKLSEAILRTQGAFSREQYDKNPKKCNICGNIIPYELRHKKTCSENCAKILRSKLSQLAGQASAQHRVIRSKNEIYFYELCEKYFKEVKHNEPIFNGWDADIIIEDIKYAILWNGPWHYRQVTKDHNLEQVQNRDKIKLSEIQKCGYTAYTIKDNGKYKPTFVEEQFKLFINSLS